MMNNILNASRVRTSHSAPGGGGFSRNRGKGSRNCGRSSRADKRRGRRWARANSETEAWECIRGDRHFRPAVIGICPNVGHRCGRALSDVGLTCCPNCKKWSWPRFPRPRRWAKSGQFFLKAFCKMAMFRPLAAKIPRGLLARPGEIRSWLIVLTIRMMQTSPMILTNLIIMMILMILS